MTPVGRVTTATDKSGLRRLLRLCNIIWLAGSNRQSVVLDVHSGDRERAESHAWADHGGRCVGMNLRSLQTSCTLEGSGA